MNTTQSYISTIVILIFLTFFLSCDKEETGDYDPNLLPKDPSASWAINDSIQFNGPVEYIFADDNDENLYVSGITWINEKNESIHTWNGSYWTHLPGNISSVIYSMAMYNDTLYVAGSGLHCEGYDGRQTCVKFTGNSWVPALEENGWGRAITVFDNSLYLGCSGTMKYSDTTWMQISEQEPVKFTELNNELYAIASNKVVKWVDQEWQIISGSVNKSFYSLNVHNNKLYAGTSCGKESCENNFNIYQLNEDQSWEQIPIIVDTDKPYQYILRDIISYNDELYAAIWLTLFTIRTETAITIREYYLVAKLTDNNWVQVGDLFNRSVYKFSIFQNQLYLCGGFTGGIATLND